MVLREGFGVEGANDSARYYAYAFHSSAQRTVDGSAYYVCQEEWARKRRKNVMLGSWVAMLMVLSLGSWVICNETL